MRDENNVLWRRIIKTEVFDTDLAEFQSVNEERRMTHEVNWLVKLQDRSDLPAVPKLYAHGWKSREDFTYVRVLESPEDCIWNFVSSPYHQV